MFVEDIIRLSTGIELAKFVFFVWGNWDNYKLDNNIVVGIKDVKEGSVYKLS